MLKNQATEGKVASGTEVAVGRGPAQVLPAGENLGVLGSLEIHKGEAQLALGREG